MTIVGRRAIDIFTDGEVIWIWYGIDVRVGGSRDKKRKEVMLDGLSATTGIRRGSTFVSTHTTAHTTTHRVARINVRLTCAGIVPECLETRTESVSSGEKKIRPLTRRMTRLQPHQLFDTRRS